ncbi:MAG TPA: GatB/YqeY domain-containing protein [Acidimicrobiia bacterium]|nr:GatB/YqeY domain-containing protein [Acidimicrobiia bacterium]
MTIKEELAQELKDAMRAQDGPRRDVIRQVETEVAVARSQPGFEGEVDDELYLDVIASYVKKMDKARDEYLEIGERGAAMADKLGYEVEYLSRWLPSKLDEDATLNLVKAAIAELGVAGDEKAEGRVMGHLMKTHGKDLDGGLVNRVVREELASG